MDVTLDTSPSKNPQWDMRAEARYEEATIDPFNEPLEVRPVRTFNTRWITHPWEQRRGSASPGSALLKDVHWPFSPCIRPQFAQKDSKSGQIQDLGRVAAGKLRDGLGRHLG